MPEFSITQPRSSRLRRWGTAFPWHLDIAEDTDDVESVSYVHLPDRMRKGDIDIGIVCCGLHAPILKKVLRGCGNSDSDPGGRSAGAKAHVAHARRCSSRLLSNVSDHSGRRFSDSRFSGTTVGGHGSVCATDRRGDTCHHGSAASGGVYTDGPTAPSAIASSAVTCVSTVPGSP